MAPLDAPAPARSVRGRRGTLAFAWVATLLLSGLLQVLLVEVAGVDAPPMAVIWLLVAVALLVLAQSWDAARPLRGYLAVMLVVVVAMYVVLPPAIRWTGADTGSESVLWTRVVMLAVALGVAALLVVLLHRRPRDLFLTVGDLRAPTGVRLPGTRRPLTWAGLGPAATVVLAVGFAAQMWLESAFPGSGWARLLAAAPLVLAAAVLNASTEEVLFRAGPLATLHRVVGPTQAVLLTAAWFGLAHYYGSIPSGPAGALQSALLGLLLGAAMVGSRGLGWPITIHVAIDVVVFASMVVAVP